MIQDVYDQRSSTYQRQGVDGAYDHGRKPDADDGAAGVGEDGRLVLDGVPLPEANNARTVTQTESIALAILPTWLLLLHCPLLSHDLYVPSLSGRRRARHR